MGGKIGGLLALGSGLLKWGWRGVVTVATGTAAAAASDSYLGTGILPSAKRGATDLGQGAMEAKELVEARAIQLDAEFNSRARVVGIASFISSLLKFVGLTSLAARIDDTFIKGEKAYLDSVKEQLNGNNPTPQQQTARDAITNEVSAALAPATSLANNVASGLETVVPNAIDNGSKVAAVAETALAATVASKVTTGSWNPLTMVTSGFSKALSYFKGNNPAPAVDNLASTVGNAADDAARASVSLADDAATAAARMPRGGKLGVIAAIGVGGAAAYSWLTGENPVVSTANAAVDPNASVDAKAVAPSTQPDISTGAPIEATLIAGSGAVVAASSLGVKAIPLVGGVVTAADTLWNTGSYLFQGEFSKAGTELVAGTGLTLGATGGFLTYGLGEAWHAGVRDSAIAVIGSDAEIGKAPLRSVFEMATGVNTDMATAPQPERPTVAAFQAAVANSEIRVPAPAMEYDIMGNATGFSAPSSEGLDLGSSFASVKDSAPVVAADAAAAKRRPARGQQPALESHLH